MSAPSDVTIKNLSGKWVMNKTLSDDPDAVLALQGISWFMRRAISWATITLSASQYVTPEDRVTHIDIDQTATGGIKGTSEKRVLDWTLRDTDDGMFGPLRGRSRWVGTGDEGTWTGEGTMWFEDGAEGEGLLDEFMKEGWLEGSEEEGEGGKTHVMSWVRNREQGWLAMQVWGFAMVAGEDGEEKRYYTRRVVVRKEEEVLMIRLVYDWQGKD